MNEAARVLVEHALHVRWEQLPAVVRRAAKTFLHDTLCVGVAGRNAPGSELVFAAANHWSGELSGGAGCRVLGRPGSRMPAPYAAFVNAFQTHAQEFDAVHEGAVAHPMATVVAVLLAEAERCGPVCGADFLAATVAGVDVVATLGVAGTSPLKFFRPATAGIFGSVAALCRLRGLECRIGVDAMGYALAFASGTMQAHVEGKPALAVQVAAAARSAIEAVDLAVAGMSGPAGSIDGPFGYLNLFEDRHDLSAPLATLGSVWRIAEVSWKPFPTGRAAHGAIVALQTLMRDHRFDAADVSQVVYEAPPLIARLVGRAAHATMSVAHARLCLPYLCAIVLRRGTVGLEDFDARSFADRSVLDLATRIEVRVNDIVDPAAFVPALCTVTLEDGRLLKQPVSRQFGAPEWPLTDAQHRAKALACLAFGGLPDAHDALLEAIERLPDAEDAVAALASVFGRA